MSVKIVYRDIAAGADEDALVTAPGAADHTDPALLPFGGSGSPIATLEPFSWLLDGSRELLDGQPLAYWSEAMSGPDGRFETPPEISIRFDSRYTSPGLLLTFDPATGDYCSHVTVEWYRGANLLKKKDFYPAGPEAFCAQTVEAWDGIVLRLRATGRPYRYAKLQKILFGVDRTFLRNELRGVRATQEVSIISDQVAVNTLDFTLDSKADIDYMFQMKQPVSAYDGDRLVGVFYIDGHDHRGKGLWSISCKDAIGVLDDDPYPARMLNGEPARELLEDVLGGHFRLELDGGLAAAPLTGYLPGGSRRQALQQIAFALCAMVDTSGTDAVRVYKDREEQPGKIPLQRTYINGAVDTSAIVTAVQVTSHSYSTSGTGNDTVEVDGVTYYHTAAVTAITNPNVTAGDKPNVVEVKEATLVDPGRAAAVAQHLYSYYMKRSVQKVKIVMDGEKPGDHIAAATPWDTVMDGFITSMHITLSGIAAAECSVVGVDVRAVGGSEEIASGEVMSGEV